VVVGGYPTMAMDVQERMGVTRAGVALGGVGRGVGTQLVLQEESQQLS
jgi:hypothetical protein